MSKISQALDGKDPNHCAFSKILLTLDADDIEAVVESIAKGNSGYVIANALRAGGFKIAASTVHMHITSKCKCP